jgi:hypothetical protein
MRTGIVLAGLLALSAALVIEVVAVYYATDILQHNVYGFGGGILAVLGIVAVGIGRAPKNVTRR